MRWILAAVLCGGGHCASVGAGQAACDHAVLGAVSIAGDFDHRRLRNSRRRRAGDAAAAPVGGYRAAPPMRSASGRRTSSTPIDGIDLPYIANSWLYHGPRLALQPVIVWWALYCAGGDRLAVAAIVSGRRTAAMVSWDDRSRSDQDRRLKFLF